MNPKWLIYARVSSQRQVNEWNWLSSQEKRCKDYAKNSLWIDIEKVFYDEWVSWWLFERKSIRELLRYIDTHNFNEYVVIIEDLNRLSRDIQVHHLLKEEFKKRNTTLACVNFKFENSPEWDFKENISVVVSEYERKKNKQRVIDRQRARLEQGFWCFRVPLGFKYTKSPNWWKIIIQDEIICKKIKYAFEKYGNNEIASLSDLLIYLNNKWIKLKWLWKNNRVLSLSSIHWLITNPLYAWYLECKKWDIWLMKAQHKWIISLKTFEKIQNKLISKSQIKRQIEENSNRIDVSDDFPLRWFLYCEESKGMFSAGWSKWKTKKIPYYTFPRKSPLRWKSLNRDKFHNDFKNILQHIQPKADLIECLENTIKDLREKNNDEKEDINKVFKKEIIGIDKKINTFLNRIWNTDNETLLNNYEKKIRELEQEKIEISLKIENNLNNVWTPIKNKITLVKNSLQIWNKWDLEIKKKLIKNIFPEWIPITKKRSVWTPKFSLIYQSFSIWESSFPKMVELDGFEPTSRKAKEILLLS